MIPKKPKDFIKPTSESLDLSESIVGDIVDFYWSSVRKALSDIEGPFIKITNLGTFKVRYNKIHQIEQKYQNYLNNINDTNLESMTFNKHALQKMSNIKLERLQKVKQDLEQEYSRKAETKLKREAYVTNKNLEK